MVLPCYMKCHVTLGPAGFTGTTLAQLDKNGDGVVDFFSVLYSGYDAAAGGVGPDGVCGLKSPRLIVRMYSDTRAEQPVLDICWLVFKQRLIHKLRQMCRHSDVAARVVPASRLPCCA